MIAQELPSASRTCPRDSFAERLAERIGQHRYDMWFDNGARVHIGDGRLDVETDSPFVAEWIRGHFSTDLQAIARETLGSAAGVTIRVAEPWMDEGVGHAANAPATQPECTAPAGTRFSEAHRPGPKRRLEDFVVGECNRVAYASACRMADPRGGGPSLLIVHGGCGLGKTHLLQGICHRFESVAGRTQTVRYLTGEQFTNEYLASLRTHAVDAFRRRIRRLELLAIDDVHFLANKTATQAEFLHTLDAIGHVGAQVVLASDEHPRDIQRFSHGLVSRFLSGLIVRLDLPDRATRMALVRRIAAARGVSIHEAAVDRIAGECNGSIRELEGAVTTLAALRSFSPEGTTDGDIGLILTERFLAERDARPASPVRMGDLVNAVCRRFSIEPDDLLGGSRHRRIVRARGAVAFLARDLTTLSYPEIAAALGRSNHSTIHTAAQRFRRQLALNETFDLCGGSWRLADLVADLRQELVRLAAVGSAAMRPAAVVRRAGSGTLRQCNARGH